MLKNPDIINLESDDEDLDDRAQYVIYSYICICSLIL